MSGRGEHVSLRTDSSSREGNPPPVDPEEERHHKHMATSSQKNLMLQLPTTDAESKHQYPRQQQQQQQPEFGTRELYGESMIPDKYKQALVRLQFPFLCVEEISIRPSMSLILLYILQTPSELYKTMHGVPEEGQSPSKKHRSQVLPETTYNVAPVGYGNESSEKVGSEKKTRKVRKRDPIVSENKTPEIIEVGERISRSSARESVFILYQRPFLQLLNIADYTRQVESSVPINRPLFSPRPDCIEFRNFKPFQETTQKLRLLNKDSVRFKNRDIDVLRFAANINSPAVFRLAGTSTSENRPPRHSFLSSHWPGDNSWNADNGFSYCTRC